MANSFSVKDKVDESDRVEKKVIGGDSMLGQDRVEKKCTTPSRCPQTRIRTSVEFGMLAMVSKSGIFIMLTLFESESHVLLPLHHSSQC